MQTTRILLSRCILSSRTSPKLRAAFPEPVPALCERFDGRLVDVVDFACSTAERYRGLHHARSW